MGSNIISKQDAAKLLGVSPRTIYSYLNKGTLRPGPLGTKTGVLEEDVQILISAKSSPIDIAFTKANFQKMYLDIQYLKSMVHTLAKIYDLKLDRLNLPDKELHQYYEAAKNYAGNGWPPHVEQTWADTFLRLHIDDLRQLQAYLKEDHPWRPFYLLCTCMYQSPFNKFLVNQFNAGRHHLHQLITCWGQVRGESPSVIQALVRDIEPMKRKLNQLMRDKIPAGKSPF